MSIVPITEEQRKQLIEDISYDDAQMQSKIQQVKEWMKKQPHLPQLPDEMSEKIIFTILLGTKMSTERTKYKLDTFYAMRHQFPEIFLNIDPTLKDVRDSVDKIRYFPLSEMTDDGNIVIVLSFNPDKSRKCTTKDIKALFKRTVALNDIWFQRGELFRGQYVLFDTSGLSASHLTELPWLFMRKFAAFGQIQIFHNYGDLYKYIPQRILPADYGGDGLTVEESSRAWQKTIESVRESVIEEGKRMTDESKRPSDSVNDCGQIFGVNGTFIKLNID
ncbi:uncharacterized protein LOC124354751 isoform X2 [Homalodisca vitripennis]|uniref:uncharacterized protein LOC124354751 isoform X2 n=1 Tax=Homalodisca vitripennis TaxID=197043 RepID=UPI001EEC0D1E|nr:uncharacterized protein LOC124354751 isoform X2 [Homalodisca vitripennis]